MPSDPNAARETPSSAPLTASSRHRVQKVFEHGQRCAMKHDHDYANQLFAQCVAEDPASILYLQAFLENLQAKFGDKKPSRMAGLKVKSHRSALAKAAGVGNWPAAFQAGCAALAINPWDAQTLVALADACQELHIDECQLYYLRWSLNHDPKDPVVNRRAAIHLTRMGQFDQAIACWNRVAQAKPEDEEARQAISQLSVEQTIHKGGYDPAMLDNAATADPAASNIARYSREAREGTASDEPDLPLEQRFQAALTADPSDVEAALNLADLYLHESRFDDADRVLQLANEAAGGGNLTLRERQEDVQLRRIRQQVQIAEQQAQTSDAAREQASQIRKQANQIELEVYATRSQRDPENPRLKFELGVRLKKAGKTKEAISALQAARSDSKRLVTVLLGLGECFQKIEQYKLALSNYEQAVEAASGPSAAGGDVSQETLKLALYRAGVLATGLRELDRAERHLTVLAGLDFGYRDVAERLDKINRLRDSG